MYWSVMLSISSFDDENDNKVNEPCRATVGGLRKGNRLNENVPMKSPLLKRPIMSTFIVKPAVLGVQLTRPVKL